MSNAIRFFLIMMSLTIVFLSSCGGSSTVVDSSRRVDVSPEKMLCVFRSDIDEEYNYEIYLCRTDKGPIGPNEELVLKLTDTASPAAEVFPTIARDCNTVVYCSSVNDLGTNPFFPDFDIYKVMVDTGEITQLTDTGQDREYAPSISADGNVLTFMVGSFMRSGSDLYMMYMDKPGDRILIQENLGQNVFPRITADGKYAVYSAPTGATKKMDIFIVNLQTREVKNVTRTPDIEEYYPDISDDMNIITYQVQKITTPPATEEEPAAASDGGTQIAQANPDEPVESPDETEPGAADDSTEKTVESTEGGETVPPEESAPATTEPVESSENYWNIWILNTSNGEKIQVTDNQYHDVYPIISGDGTWVVYTSAREDLNGDSQNEFLIYMYDLVAMKEIPVSTQPFHHDTVDISW